MTEVNAKSIQTGYSKVTYSDVGNFINKKFNSQEQTLIAFLISACETLIARETGRNFAYSNVLYYEDLVAGTNLYKFRNTPVLEINKILLDNVIQYEVEGNSNIYTLNIDFTPYTDSIYFYTIPTSLIRSSNGLRIYYTIEKFWGDDVKLAIMQWVGEIFLSRDYAGKKINSINSNGVSVSFNSAPDYVKDIIASYTIANL